MHGDERATNCSRKKNSNGYDYFSHKFLGSRVNFRRAFNPPKNCVFKNKIQSQW